ncbi:hypothetical protein M8J76_000386 [Diaphorina citri]|nr:hypothetical protein M8J76_000386 [Diaphorina citri]
MVFPFCHLINLSQAKGERKNSRKNNNNSLYNSSSLASSSSSTLAMYNPAAYFQYSSNTLYSSDVSLVRHKAKLVGTSPPPPPPPSRGKKDKNKDDPPPSSIQYHRPKFDKNIDPIVRVSLAVLYCYRMSYICPSYLVK